ncbi:MAG: hypothetical protein FH751_06695 [Firmicutes bacterium]|nr:hypothetical protein [Bacillota bacterium]
MGNNEKNELEDKVYDLALKIEKTKIAEYVDILDNKWRLLSINFVAGLARGFGMAVGFTILGALFIYIAQRIITLNLPVIGDFIAELVKIVKQNL